MKTMIPYEKSPIALWVDGKKYSIYMSALYLRGDDGEHEWTDEVVRITCSDDEVYMHIDSGLRTFLKEAVAITRTFNNIIKAERE